MDVESYVDDAVCGIASAIGEPARARMLYSLMDNRARTSTELAVVANVSPSTASVHLNRLKAERLVTVRVQGKHRYYSLEGPGVARVLESLNVLAGGKQTKFVPSTPTRLRAARTCYDHMAGALGVSIHDRIRTLGWLSPTYELTPKGANSFDDLGIEARAAQAQRRRFAYACLDWSERRSHLGGALGALLLRHALVVTNLGRRDMEKRFGLAELKG
jgi:DNA-binding transcriptional ArsR family regulator